MIVDPLLKSDDQIHNIIHPKIVQRRERQIEQLFEKDYKDITEQELGEFVSNFCKRLYLLKKHFPSNLVELLKGVLEHPAISELDKSVVSSLK